MERREFFKLTALTTGGFMLGAQAQDGAEKVGEPFSPNAFIEINADGVVTIIGTVADMGQGTKTTLPMIIAEELEVNWEDVIVTTKPMDEKVFGSQSAGGSQSIRKHYKTFRQLGAAAKSMLIEAAAREWGVAAKDCVAQSSMVKHGDKSLTYAQLATLTSGLKPPELKDVKVKNPDDFKLLGKRIGGVDNKEIVTGKPLYGIDQVREGMKYASFVRCPSFKGNVKSVDLETIKKMDGVTDAFILKEKPTRSGGLYGGVAVIATSTWYAQKAALAAQPLITWDTPDMSPHSSEKYEEAAQKVIKARKNEDGGIESVYHYPLLAHNTLEPQNSTVLYKDGKLEFWAPTQHPIGAVKAIVSLLKVKADKITINVVRSGGGFGRRLNSDVMVEAAAIAMKQEGTPIKLTWTRENDIQQDYYRNPGWHHLQGDVNEKGEITRLSDHTLALGPNTKTPGNAGKMNAGIFPISSVPKKKAIVKSEAIQSYLPLGWWRAPGSNGIAFAVQCFTDELAHKAGKDPLAFRKNLINQKGKQRFDNERMLGVLDAVAKKADWGKELPEGSAQGIAFYFSHQGHAAVVAEVTVAKNGDLTVDKMTAALDVGPILNLSGAENQVQGSLLDALSSSWFQKITLKDGVVQNTNFHDYPVLRMPQAPVVEAVFVESDNPPSGLGEPALPPAVPALCNAIFSACGKRIRTLPIMDNDLSWG